MSEWNHEKTIHLINLYEQKPELWDPSSNNYHLRNKKNDAWLHIATELKCDVAIINGKMASLLSSLRREKARMKATTGTRKGQKDVYISKWFAFPSFAFLMDKDKIKETINTVNDLHTDAVVDCEVRLDVPTDIEDMSASLGETSVSDQSMQEAHIHKRKILLSPRKTALKKKSQEDPRIVAAYDILRNVSNTPKDECFTYGQHIAAKLQKFDDDVRSVVMHLMNNIIFDAEMGKYNNYMNNSYGQTSGQYSKTPYVLSPSPTYSAYSYQSNQSQDSPNSQFNVTAPRSIPQLPEKQSAPLQDFIHSLDDEN